METILTNCQLPTPLPKGVYPYEYMDSFERFQEPQLPPKDAFYSSLTEEDISKTDYTHAQRVSNHFNMTDHGIITTFICKPMFFYWRTCLRISETCASNIMVLIPPMITPPMVCLSRLLLK